MKKGYLLAMTPRAGSTNHRYLASNDDRLSDSDANNILGKKVDEAIASAERSTGWSVGPDFLAVCKFGVLQADGERLGNEVLLLGDVKPKEMTDAGKNRLHQYLESCMPKLKQLIEEIPWERTPGLLVNRQELDEWLNNLPEPRKKRWWIRNCKWLIFAVVIVLAVTFILFRPWIGSFLGSTSPTPSQKQPSRTDDKVKKSYEDRFNDWVDKICNESGTKVDLDKAKRELAEIVSANGDRRNPTPFPDVPEVKAFLDKPDAIDSEYIFAGNTRSNALKVWMNETTAKSRLIQVVSARNCLLKAGKEFRRFIDEVPSKELPDDLRGYPLLMVASKLASIRSQFILDAEDKPDRILPLFDKHDREILEAIRELSGLLEDNQAREMTPDKLLIRLNVARQCLVEKLDDEYLQFRKTNPLNTQDKAMRRLKAAVLDLTLVLGTIPFSLRGE